MIAAYSAAAIRDAEAAAAGELPDGMLMQRASVGLATHCLRLLAQWRGRVSGSRVCLLVGSGGNGGDALYAGAVLRQRGILVTAVLLDPQRTYPGARTAFESSGGVVLPISDRSMATLISESDLVVDGLVGLASGRPLTLPTSVAQAIGGHEHVVAVDLPSGVGVDGGTVAAGAIRARATITFGARKPAHLLFPAIEYCGSLECVDIGLDDYLPEPQLRALTDGDLMAAWPRPAVDGHKYSLGVVGLVAGSDRYPGAAVLCASGALRAKPGMVRFIGDGHVRDQIIAAWPETVPAPSIAETARTDAWVVGPGLGTDDRAQSLVDEALALDVPVLFDADALTMLAKQPDALRRRTAATVLSPHAGEFVRMFGEIDDPLGSALEAAESSGSVVLLKGPTTVIASPDGQAYVNTTGTPRLATAGSGDVLAGMIGALLAAGIEPALSAAMAAHAHGAAAGNSRGFLVASDLPGLLREYLSTLLR